MIPIGTRVRMSSVGRDNYENYSRNPHNSTGVVVSNNYLAPHIYRVEWGLDVWNCYRGNEIEPADTINLEDLM